MSVPTKLSSPPTSGVDRAPRRRSRSHHDPLPTGAFSWTISTGIWHWSAETFAMFGYRPGAIEPTTELVLSHTCADAGSMVDDIVAACRRGATRFSSYRPIVTAHGRTTMLLAAGTIDNDDHHHLTIDGQLVDLTAQHRQAGNDAVRAATHTRDQISQAVGVIMASHHLDATAAFKLLVAHSQTHNTKLAVLAHRLVHLLPDLPAADSQRAHVDRLLHAAATQPDTNPAPLARRSPPRKRRS